MEKFGWKKFSLLALVPFLFYLFIEFELDLLYYLPFVQSYVLFQERHVLFNPKGAGNNSGLSRAGTRKATTQRLPDQDIFEPGSLLSKQI